MEGRLDETGGAAEQLAEAAAGRLQRLDTGTFRLLRMAAVLGGTFEVHDLATVLGRSAASMVDALAEAHEAGLLTETGDGKLTFRHRGMREALTAELSASLRTALHREFAEALAMRGAQFCKIAEQLRAAPGPAEPWMVRWLSAVPEAALSQAAEPAAELLESAVDGPALSVTDREELLCRLMKVLHLLGRDTRADELAAETLRADDDPKRRGRAWLIRIVSASRMQRLSEAVSLAAAALDDPVLEPGARALIRARCAAALIKQGAHEQSRFEAELALREATEHRDPVAAGHARLVLSHIVREPTAALEQVDAALAGLGPSDDPDLRILLLDNRLAALNNLGRAGEFRDTARMVPDLVRRGAPDRTARLLFAAAMGSYDFGWWDETLAYLDRMPGGVTAPPRIGRHGLAALVHAHREQWDQAEWHLAAGSRIEVVSTDGRIWSGYLVAADAMRAVTDGDLRHAADLLAIWLEPPTRYDARERYMWLPPLLRLARTLGDDELASAVAQAADEDARLPEAPAMQRAAGRLGRAQLSGDTAELLALAKVYEQHGWPFMRAFATEEAAVHFAAAGQVDAARTAFNDAVRGYSALGSTWDVRRVDARLRPLGIRRGSRTLDQRAASGWESLTAAERRVAELVATGRSNPDVASVLFLSPRTVQTHVTHILRKLGYSSRTDLIRDAGRR
jgi:DNA-binding CsgD family transcriptional regulator